MKKNELLVRAKRDDEHPSEYGVEVLVRGERAPRGDPRARSHVFATVGPGSRIAVSFFDLSAYVAAERMAVQTGTYGYINHVYARPEKRRSGLGARMVRAAIDKMVQLGAKDIYLEAAPEDDYGHNVSLDALLSFYRKLGFVRDTAESGGNLLHLPGLHSHAATPRRPNASSGWITFDRDELDRWTHDGEVLAKAARDGDRTALRALARWAGTMVEFVFQIAFSIEIEAERSRNMFAYQAAVERGTVLRSNVAGPLLRGALAARDGTDPTEILAMASEGSMLRQEMWNLVDLRFGQLQLRPAIVFVPKRRHAVVGGVAVDVGEAEGETTIIPDNVIEGLQIYHRSAVQRVPWMLGRKAAPIELLPYNARMSGSYVFDAAVVRLYLPRVKRESPRQVAHVLAHEQGHHVWRTRLSEPEQNAWSRLVRERMVPLDADAVLSVWPEEQRHWNLLAASPYLAEVAAKNPGPLAYQILIAARNPVVRNADLRSFARWAAEGGSVMVPAKPVSSYGHTNAEEAFCDALGLLVSAGPRAVDPEALDLLREMVPGTRVSNPSARRGNARVALTVAK